MSEEEQLSAEIRALKLQIENLKAAIGALQNETEKKEVAIANIAREKEKITMELLRQKRSNNNLNKQLEEERKFYFKEKEQYCEEMNEFKKLKRVLSTASTSKKEAKTSEQYQREIEKIKRTLSETLEANYNLSIKFLRMKNTKTCLKTELKTTKLEHEKLVNDYKTRIHSLSEELNNLIQERLDEPISCSNKKYLQLVKQNSCLVYENLCLQLEVDNLRIKCEKLKLEKKKSESNHKLGHIQSKTPKTVRIEKQQEREEEKPEKDLSNVEKIYERHQLPGVPHITFLTEYNERERDRKYEPPQIPSVQEKIPKQESSRLIRVHSSPDISHSPKPTK
ncbi:uncharacterized protein MAL8P1.12-like isoform X2 [Anthonomus grandis grandis]|nr:uncharacterized protein MAL8P1.12-like isoform X2 [Anthonomus grandis grandis]